MSKHYLLKETVDAEVLGFDLSMMPEILVNIVFQSVNSMDLDEAGVIDALGQFFPLAAPGESILEKAVTMDTAADIVGIMTSMFETTEQVSLAKHLKELSLLLADEKLEPLKNPATYLYHFIANIMMVVDKASHIRLAQIAYMKDKTNENGHAVGNAAAAFDEAYINTFKETYS